MPLGVKPTVDFAFKKTFGSPECSRPLIGLLNAILEPDEPIVGVDILNLFHLQEFEEEKLIVLDVKARDSRGQWLNVEMQVSVYPGLLPRLRYYACSMFVGQLELGDHFHRLRPAISICLLNRELFGDSSRPHHRFRLVDVVAGRQLENGIEIHTLELPKYNLEGGSIRIAGHLEQWAFFLLLADQYDPEELRAMLPSVEY